MADDRPNILLIMSDEHDAAVTGCYGDKLVRTPHLDSLAARGVTFDNCYCNSPLCVPSRMSSTAGQYISRVGGWANSCRLPSDDYPSLPRALARAGVAPYLCGKQHYDQSHRYGFIDLLPEMNQHRMTGKHAHRAPGDRKINHRSWTARAADIRPGDESSVMRHDQTVTGTAVEFLRQQRRADGPFFLFVGHLAPHFPLIAPQEIWEHYRGRVPMPVIPEGLFEGQPLNYQHLRWGFGLVDIPPEIVQRGRELYWALTDWYDRQIGQILAALAGSAAAANTVVIYTSDHGENKGDHGLWWKNNCYDHGARVPLIVSDPRQRASAGGRRSGVCSLVDLVATIAQLQVAEPEPGWDGDSLSPLLADAKSPWKDTAISQYYGHNIMSGMTMYRAGRWKYIRHARVGDFGGERELYDMPADPQELHNLASKPEHAARLTQMHQAMVREIGEEPEATEARCMAETARGYAQP